MYYKDRIMPVKHVISETSIIKRCHFCGESHKCKECPLEDAMSPILKKKAGMLMEHYIANNFFCPCCNMKKLNVIDNNSPSLDIICSNCNKKIEVKSKCLSSRVLPDDLTILHGNYIDFLNRIEEDLDMVIVIYGVNRLYKTIEIREILYLPNEILREQRVITISKRKENNLSMIQIDDKNALEFVPIDESTKCYDFSQDIKDFVQAQRCSDCFLY